MTYKSNKGLRHLVTGAELLVSSINFITWREDLEHVNTFVSVSMFNDYQPVAISYLTLSKYLTSVGEVFSKYLANT